MKLGKNQSWKHPAKGMTLCFFADDGDDDGGSGGANSSNSSQEEGNTNNGASGDRTSPDTYEVVVSGRKVEMTLDELKAKASEATGAQQKFQEAAELRQQAQEGMRLMNLAKKMQEGTAGPADVNEFVRLVGGDPAELENFMEQQNAQQHTNGQTPPQNQSYVPQKVTKDQLDPEIQRTLDRAQESQLAQIREKLERQTREGIDNDEVLSKIISGLPADVQSDVKQELYDMAIERVRNNVVLDNKPFGAALVQEVARALRSRVKRLGIPATSGQMPTSVSGPGGGFGGPQIPLDKTIERVPSTDPDYIEKMTQRVQQSMAKMALRQR